MNRWSTVRLHFHHKKARALARLQPARAMQSRVSYSCLMRAAPADVGTWWVVFVGVCVSLFGKDEPVTLKEKEWGMEWGFCFCIQTRNSITTFLLLLHRANHVVSFTVKYRQQIVAFYTLKTLVSLKNIKNNNSLYVVLQLDMNIKTYHHHYVLLYSTFLLLTEKNAWQHFDGLFWKKRSMLLPLLFIARIQ